MDVEDAVRRAMELAVKDDMVIVMGSVFLVGEARELWFEPTNPDLSGLEKGGGKPLQTQLRPRSHDHAL